MRLGPFNVDTKIADIETTLMMRPENSGDNDDIRLFYQNKMLDYKTCRYYNLNRHSVLEYANVVDDESKEEAQNSPELD